MEASAGGLVMLKAELLTPTAPARLVATRVFPTPAALTVRLAKWAMPPVSVTAVTVPPSEPAPTRERVTEALDTALAPPSRALTWTSGAMMKPVRASEGCCWKTSEAAAAVAVKLMLSIDQSPSGLTPFSSAQMM